MRLRFFSKRGLRETQRVPVAFLAALTCLTMVSLVLCIEPLASEPMASEVFI